jgi:hypothetical protein
MCSPVLAYIVMNAVVRDLMGRTLLGVTAPRALAMILSSLDDVDEIYLTECRPLPPLQSRRTLGTAERIVFERALESRERTGLPFWDAALLELPAVPDALPLLDDAMMHVTFRGKEHPLSYTSAVAGGIEHACAEYSTGAGASLTFLSEVRCRGGLKNHLPMIDFHAASSDPNQRVVTAVTKRLFPDGAVLLESGESYHAYGTRLISDAEFRRFLGKALLFAPIVDRAYVAHQIIEGRCALRISAGGGKSRIPTVVALIPGS